MKLYKCGFEEHYPQRMRVVKYKGSKVRRQVIKIYTSNSTSAKKIFGIGSIVFAAGTEYLRGRVPPPTQVRSACISQHFQC